MTSSELAYQVEVLEQAPEVEFDEPMFPTEEHAQLYRDLVNRMEAEATVLPGMSTVVGMMIRKLARDYVYSVVGDHGYSAVTLRENDKRMMETFKLLLAQAARADLEHALRTEFVLGLVTETMKVLDAEIEDQNERIRIKELMSHAFVTYTDSVRGRIKA